MHKPSELHLFLKEHQLRPCAALSQNFLICGNTITRMIASSGCQPGDLVLEIGPGPGALTEGLLKAGMRVIAVEKDRVFAGALSRLDKELKQLTVFDADALDFGFKEELRARLQIGEKGYVVANLPYHLTTPLLMRLLPLQEEVRTLTLMVQKEMAERLVAAVGSPRYGWLAPYVRFFGQAKILFSVPKQLFFPKPAVDSVVVQILLHASPLSPLRATHFISFLLSAFSQPRKMVRSRWAPSCSKEEVEKALRESGCSELARPEEISFEQWLKLFTLLESYPIDFTAFRSPAS